MANEIRLRRNNIAGTITDNPLTNVATTINSPGFVDLPTVDTTNHLILILDPLETAGPAEIVRVTAHTAAATSVTVTRGAEGSAARTHSLGTTWFHGPVASDTDLVDVTSSTRPSVPYTGELIVETDTKKLMGYTGTDWAPRDAGGTLGYAQVTTSQGSIVGTTDLTGLTTTVTVGTNRRIRVSFYCATQSTVDGDLGRVDIVETASILGFSQHRLQTSNCFVVGSTILTPSAGSHTYKLQFGRSAGSGTLTLNAAVDHPNYILVEDIGAA